MNKLQLRDQVRSLINRNDVTDAQLDSFVDLALGRIQRKLRIPPMEAVFTATLNSNWISSFQLPSDFLEFKDLYNSDFGKLKYLPLGRFLEAGANTNVYTRVGGRVDLKAQLTSDLTVTLLYYAEFPDLTTDTSTNWLTDNAPELLIYGALVFGADTFVDERKAEFEATFQTLLGEVELQAQQLEASGGDHYVSPAYSNY